MRPVLAALGLMLCAASAQAQSELPPKIDSALPLATALQGAQAARVACAGHPVSVAVTDPAGELKVLLASDGGNPLFSELAWRKARTAAHFRVPSAVTGEQSRTDATMFFRLSGAQFSYYGGGLPIFQGSTLVGALAVSGAADPAGDVTCANAGAAFLAHALNPARR